MNESFIASQIAPTLRLESQCDGEDAREPLIADPALPHQRLRWAVEYQESATALAWLKITLGF